MDDVVVYRTLLYIEGCKVFREQYLCRTVADCERSTRGNCEASAHCARADKYSYYYCIRHVSYISGAMYIKNVWAPFSALLSLLD